MIMQCVNPSCGLRTSKAEADQRNFNNGACSKCGWGIAEVVDNLPNKIGEDLDRIFSETYLPIQVRTDLEKLIVKYADTQKFNGKKEAFEHIKKDLSNYGVTEADYVMGLYSDLLIQESERGW